MEIFYGLDYIQPVPEAVVTTGTFDGVHIGHRRILERLKEIATRRNGKTVVITYEPHPRLVLTQEKGEIHLLNSLSEKAELIAGFGIDFLIVLPFTTEFSNLHSKEFVSQILVEKIQTKCLVIGYDHRFGKNREGGFDYLKTNSHLFGFEVEEIPKQEIDAVTISSTKIRQALFECNLTLANKWLGSYYRLSGIVVKGKQLGRTLGYPTANLKLDDLHKLIPPDGVYLVKVRLENDGNLMNGLLSIGTNPTVDGQKRTIETWIIDFNQDIYGNHITLFLMDFLRGQVKFKGLNALIEAIVEDEKKARAFFKLMD